MITGSEANEAAYKLCIQYHAKEKANPEPTRTLFIARDRSYHGATLGALDISGHKARRELYETALPRNTHHVSPCYSYRGLRTGETVSEYVARLKSELEQKIKNLGPMNVAAFICEPVVGAVSRASLLAMSGNLTDRVGCHIPQTYPHAQQRALAHNTQEPSMLTSLTGTRMRFCGRWLSHCNERSLRQVRAPSHI